MNVIGHDGPRMQDVAFAVEVANRTVDQMGDAVISEPTAAVTTVEESLRECRMPLATGDPHRKIIGQCVGQAERDEVGAFIRCPMR